LVTSYRIDLSGWVCLWPYPAFSTPTNPFSLECLLLPKRGCTEAIVTELEEAKRENEIHLKQKFCKRLMKNKAGGYRTMNVFIDMIYLTLGDVNIPEQIPARFRTL
jgi:hypothetical protein